MKLRSTKKLQKLRGERLSIALIKKMMDGQRVPSGVSHLIRKDVHIDQEKLLDSCLTEGYLRYHEKLARISESNERDCPV